jgi:hypothetical protein
MYKRKLTERKRKALIKDEAKASREYCSLGLTGLASDEARHKRFLQKLKH